jgi:hypothetical protein
MMAKGEGEAGLPTVAVGLSTCLPKLKRRKELQHRQELERREKAKVGEADVTEPARALQEMERVLTPGGLAWVLDMKRNISNRDIEEYVAKNMKLRGWRALSMNLIFKYFLRGRAYTWGQLEAFSAQTTFQSRELEEIDIGFNLWLTK